VTTKCNVAEAKLSGETINSRKTGRVHKLRELEKYRPPPWERADILDRREG